MAEDLDVEAMLEAPYKKEEHENSKDKSSKDNNDSKHKSSKKKKHRSRSRSRSNDRREKDRRDHDKDRRDHDKDRRDHDKEKDRDRDRRRKSRSRERRDGRAKSRDGERDRERRDRSDRDRDRDRRRKRSLTPISLPRVQPAYGRRDDLTPEERDARTVFCMQLSQRIRARDLSEFFSSVGKVQDVRLITCNKTKRFKGIAYVEFKEPESVTLALGLSGQKLLGIPIVVQHTHAERNRMAASMPNLMPKGQTGPVRLYVGSLHVNITEDMLRAIFEPFGKIESIQLIMDPETGISKGYGFLTYRNVDDAKKALEQMNGFELAGKPMKVSNVTDRTDLGSGPASLDTDELDRSGIDLGATGRLQLMCKLAEGTGLEIPQAAANVLNMAPSMNSGQPQQVAPPIATQCFMLSNMFDPQTETNLNWEKEIQDDVIEECNKHGGILHVFVDRASPQGNVYVKCPSIATAVAAVNSLHGRWFAGRVITAAYVPVINYHSLFPDAMAAFQLLTPSAPRKTM